MLTVANLEKSFATPDGPIKVVDDVGFDVAEGQCHALLGPSGCGKTTILRCIAGLEQPDAGHRDWGARSVDPARGVFVPVHERAIGMVFQSYAIWPHLTVFENVAFPLQVQRPRCPRDEIETARDARCSSSSAWTAIAAARRRGFPAASSSASRWRAPRAAAAASAARRAAVQSRRAPARRDARGAARAERRIGITALLVTHDQAEAFAMSHRLAVMDQGRIVQAGTAREIYARPGNAFIARFLGAANVLRGTIEAGATVRLEEADRASRSATIFPRAPSSTSFRAREPVHPYRPRHHIGAGLRGQVASVTFQGDSSDYPRYRRRLAARDRPARPRDRAWGRCHGELGRESSTEVFRS